MKKQTVLWIAIGLLAIVALFLVLNSGSSVDAVQATGNAVKTAAAPSYGGMVGGC